MKRTTIVLLVLVLAVLMSACASPGVPPTTEESVPTNLEKGNNYNADMENASNATQSSVRLWPWENPDITLPAFTGTVTEPGTVKSLKIIAVGDASARDALYFLPELAEEAGIEEIKIAILYRSGDIATHNNVNNTYTHYENTGDGWKTVGTDAKQADVLKSEAWDYYIVNTSLANSGKADTFGNLNSVLGTAKTAIAAKNPSVKVLFMQTWTYEINNRNILYSPFKNYDKASYDKGDYDKLQQAMYVSINDAVKSEVVTCSNLSKAATNAKNDGVLPIGTAVQNMREAYWSDGLTREGEFLSNTGKVLAAVTLFKCLTGYDINGLELSDPVFDHARPHLGVIKESANNAYLKPYEVTSSLYHVD